MTYRLAFNPTDSPVLIDAEGRSIAGQSWAAVEQDTPEVTEAAAAGRLVWPETPDALAGDGTPAGHAQALVEQLNIPEKSTKSTVKKES